MLEKKLLKNLAEARKIAEIYTPLVNELFSIDLKIPECKSLFPSTSKTLKLLPYISTICRGYWTSDNTFMTVSDGQIYINDITYIHAVQQARHRCIVHELSHLAHMKIADYDLIRDEITRTFSEGFAEFFSLDIMKEKYIINMLEHLECRALVQPPLYAKGYNFFKSVINTKAQDSLPQLIHILKQPPKKMEEIENPQLYVAKRFS